MNTNKEVTNEIQKLISIALMLFIINANQWCLAEETSHYIWDTELDQLSKQQREFLEDIVTAFRVSDMDLGKSRLHSDVLRNAECADRFVKIFEMSTIKEQYAVKVKAGKNPNSLYFSIRHQNRGEDNKRDFMKLKNVVEENGKLVLHINSCVTQSKTGKKPVQEND